MTKPSQARNLLHVTTNLKWAFVGSWTFNLIVTYITSCTPTTIKIKRYSAKDKNPLEAHTMYHKNKWFEYQRKFTIYEVQT